MKKILFIISNLNRQGPVVQLYYLCKFLDKSKFEIYIITTTQITFVDSMHDDFRSIGISIHDLKFSKIYSIVYASKKIQNFIDENSINILQSHGFRSDLISSNLERVYKITSVQNTLVYNYIVVYGRYLGRILGSINLHYIRKFDKVISCSKSVHDYLITLKLNSVVLCNAIEKKTLSEETNIETRNKFHKELNITSSCLVFITVSSELRGKNIEFLTDSFSRHGFLSYTIFVVGYVDPALCEKYRNYTNIKFIGKVNNIFDYFVASDYFVSSSTHEGMPNAVLEAMTMGLPVLLSNIPSHVEIFDKSHLKIGYIYNNNDFSDFNMKINLLINCSHKELSGNCRTIVSDYFSANSMAEEYEIFYSSILDNLSN